MLPVAGSSGLCDGMRRSARLAAPAAHTPAIQAAPSLAGGSGPSESQGASQDTSAERDERTGGKAASELAVSDAVDHKDHASQARHCAIHDQVKGACSDQASPPERSRGAGGETDMPVHRARGAGQEECAIGSSGQQDPAPVSCEPAPHTGQPLGVQSGLETSELATQPGTAAGPGFEQFPHAARNGNSDAVPAALCQADKTGSLAVRAVAAEDMANAGASAKSNDAEEVQVGGKVVVLATKQLAIAAQVRLLTLIEMDRPAALTSRRADLSCGH